VQAQRIADELRTAIAALAHRTLQHGERLHLNATAVAMTVDDGGDVEPLLERLNACLARAKLELAHCA
jgi:hypothetical protein